MEVLNMKEGIEAGRIELLVLFFIIDAKRSS